VLILPWLDGIKSPREVPFTWGLIALNLLFFAVIHTMNLTVESGLDTSNFLSKNLISHYFSHADYLHLIGNMFFLIIFGSAIEPRLGSLILYYYLYFGIVAGILFVFISQNSPPLVGASGAISGLIGYWFISERRTRTNYAYVFPIPTKKFAGKFEAPLYFSLIFFVIPDLIMFLSNPAGIGERTAYGAHVAGFVTGYLIGRFLR
jgi:membrane associated rhomboid family serine protease